MKPNIALLALILLVGIAEGIPTQQSVPDDLRSIQEVQENTCLRKAWQHYEIVLSGPVTDRADNFYLAETYHALGQANFNC